jgi:hypothetical protein
MNPPLNVLTDPLKCAVCASATPITPNSAISAATPRLIVILREKP